MTERRGWGWRATREVIVDEEQIDWNLFRNGNQNRPEQRVHPSGLACRIPCIMTGSASMALDFTWQIRPAIGPAVNSDNLRIIGPFLFMYREWPSRERRLFLLGIDGILQAVSSLASPRRLHYPRWTHGQPDQSTNPLPFFEPASSLEMLDSGISVMISKGLYRQLAS
jgi:hypothetical protein